MVAPILIGAFVVLVIYLVASTIKKRTCTINFEKSFNETNLIIASFTQGKRIWNFIIDSGASQSHIASDFCDDFLGRRFNENLNIKGVGAETCNHSILATLELRRKNFHKVMNVKVFPLESLNESLNCMSIPAHGILGSDFLIKNNVVIDFKNKKLIFK
jgi:hypothetical protein